MGNPVGEQVWRCWKNSLSLTEDGKADYIQERPNRCREHCSEIVSERKTQLQFSMGMWGWVAKEQRGSGSNSEGNIMGPARGRSWLQQIWKDSCLRQSRVSSTTWGGGCRVPNRIRYGGWQDSEHGVGFWLNWFSRLFAETDFYEEIHEWVQEPDQYWSSQDSVKCEWGKQWRPGGQL